MPGHNHPPDCPCGWCSGGGGGSRVALVGTKYIGHRPFVSRPSYASYTDPNATCPVCGASVFFYQSPYGGRVFFDDLGPPWKKHGCTDNSALPVNARSWGATWRQPATRQKLEPPAWQLEGWLPIFVEEVSQNDQWWMIRGHRPDTEGGGLVRFLSPHPVSGINKTASFYRPNLELCTFEVSYLADDAQAGVVQREFKAFRLEPFFSVNPTVATDALAGDPDKALDLAYELSFAVRDREAETMPAYPRFPDKISWALVKWLLEQSLGQGNLLAAHNLAYMLLHGHGVPVDETEAFRLLKMAEPIGVARTLELLAECHERGLGTAVDIQEAIRYRKLSHDS